MSHLKAFVFTITLTIASSLSAIEINVYSPEFLIAKQVQEDHTEMLLAMPHVIATGVGVDEEGRHVIKVFVTHPDATQLVAETLEEIPTEIIVTEPVRALLWQEGDATLEELGRTSRYTRPVPIGVSTGHPKVTAGTIGCRVTDGKNFYALSNNHVYANLNRAKIHDPVIQPGQVDGGSVPKDDIGKLIKFKKIRFSKKATNVVDAAIALTSAQVLKMKTSSGGYGKPKKETIRAKIDMPVQKYGRTTGLTKGKVIALNGVVNVEYGRKVARFVKQIFITPGRFVEGGDSGSLVVVRGKGKYKSDARRPVGLVCAGSSTIAVANPIDEVLEEMDVTIDGE